MKCQKDFILLKVSHHRTNLLHCQSMTKKISNSINIVLDLMSHDYTQNYNLNNDCVDRSCIQSDNRLRKAMLRQIVTLLEIQKDASLELVEG